MSPDYFLRFLSLAPRGEAEAKEISEMLPVTAEMSAMNLIPLELREKAAEALRDAQKLPKYLRQRRLREFMNEARSTTGAVLEDGGEAVASQIEATYGKDGKAS
jgi:regulator of protease activity HflC (stomatin/prohibitin superfamily)